MAENFPNLKKETDIQEQEAQRIPNKMNPNRPTLKHSIIKMAKVKERILKAAREGIPWQSSGLCASTATGSILIRGTKILQAVQCGQKNKNVL